MDDININTKLEVAVEILAAKIAKTSKEGYSIEDQKIQILLNEREEMYKGNNIIIDKIINEYGKEIKRDYQKV